MLTFYAIRLSDNKRGTSRFALYDQNRDGGLEVIWPTDSHLDKPKLWPCQVFEKSRRMFPAFHFKVKAQTEEPLTVLAERLAEYLGCDVQIHLLSGFAPVTRTGRFKVI